MGATGDHVPVLVVGGGPVGLAMGLVLGHLGVPTLVAERNATTTDHPKSRGCWVRTMEIFRQWGVEDAIRARGLPDGTDVFAYFDPITQTEHGRTTPEPRRTRARRGRAWSPRTPSRRSCWARLRCRRRRSASAARWSAPSIAVTTSPSSCGTCVPARSRRGRATGSSPPTGPAARRGGRPGSR